MDTVGIVIIVIVILAIGAFVIFFIKDQYNPSGMGAALGGTIVGGTIVGGKIIKSIVKNVRKNKNKK